MRKSAEQMAQKFYHDSHIGDPADEIPAIAALIERCWSEGRADGMEAAAKECGGEQHEAEDGWHCLLCEAHAEIETLTNQLETVRRVVDVPSVCEPVEIEPQQTGHGWGWAYAAMMMGKHVRRLYFAPGVWIEFVSSTLWVCVCGGKQPLTRSVWVMSDADWDATDWVLAEGEVKG